MKSKVLISSLLLLLLIIFVVLQYTPFTFLRPYSTNLPAQLNSTITCAPTLNTTLNYPQNSSDTSYSLDSHCNAVIKDSSSMERARSFNDIYEKGVWGVKNSRSGDGSSLEGAFDWIRHLRSLILRFDIRSMADLPCGDTFWQFSAREINTIEDLYFGGDISSYVIDRNRKLYASHRQKIFERWDLVQCPLPTFTSINRTHQQRGRHFDLVVVRDALQHMHIRNALKAVRNVVMSGAKYFAVSSYPPGNQVSTHTRSLDKNETLPSMSVSCRVVNYCVTGAVRDGDYYHNNINCPPFNFPLQKALLVQPSHKQFSHENDEIHVYQIDEELKQIVQNYDQACLVTTQSPINKTR